LLGFFQFKFVFWSSGPTSIERRLKVCIKSCTTF
jgi:hypothetical protein